MDCGWILSGPQILDNSLGDISDLNSFSIDIPSLRIIIIGLVLLHLYVGFRIDVVTESIMLIIH
jgi:hypothetical protein